MSSWRLLEQHVFVLWLKQEAAFRDVFSVGKGLILGGATEHPIS